MMGFRLLLEHMRPKYLFAVSFFVIACASTTLLGQKVFPGRKTTTTHVKVLSKSNGELTADSMTQGRDMSKYEDGGYFDCRIFVTVEKRSCDEPKLRDFIWRKWVEKSLGYVRVAYNSRDAESTSHIFIEQDKKGQWLVAWRIARLHSITSLSNEITNVERIVSVEQGGENANSEPSLIFKNRSGRVIERIP
jgi:hypothetical protein